MVKIDIEGVEVEFLSCAEQLLASVRLVIAVEVSPGNTAATSDKFRNHEYKLFNGPSGLRRNVAMEAAVWTTMAIWEKRRDYLL